MGKQKEFMIAGKTHTEILLMKQWTRYLWYKTISYEKKKEAMGVIEIARRIKISMAQMGEKNSFFNKNHTEEFKVRKSEDMTGENHPLYGRTGELAPMYGMGGEKSPTWKEGASFLPYCSKFNFKKKEEIRNQYNRTCVISGISALQNGYRLDVDHVNENKMQGCNGVKWLLVPLTREFHNKMLNSQNHLLLELLLYGNKSAEMNYEF